MKQENIFGEKVETPKPKKPKVIKPLKVYYVRDAENYGWLIVARTTGAVRYWYSNECGMDFEDTFSDFSIERIPALDKYIQKIPPSFASFSKDWFEEKTTHYQINPWEEEEWTKALYAEGGSFENGGCEAVDDSIPEKILSLEEMLAKECRHFGSGYPDCQEWDEESIYIQFPPKKK